MTRTLIVASLFLSLVAAPAFGQQPKPNAGAAAVPAGPNQKKIDEIVNDSARRAHLVKSGDVIKDAQGCVYSVWKIKDRLVLTPLAVHPDGRIVCKAGLQK